MSDPARCQVVGRWRITGHDMWERRNSWTSPTRARFILDEAGHGEIEFGAAHLDLNLEYDRQIVLFCVASFAEADICGASAPPRSRTMARWRSFFISSTETAHPHRTTRDCFSSLLGRSPRVAICRALG